MIKKLIKDDFLKNNAIFFIGSMAVAVLNYLYHPILGRMMSVEDFGEVQSLISLFIQLSIFMGVFNIITVNGAVAKVNLNFFDKNSTGIKHDTA